MDPRNITTLDNTKDDTDDWTDVSQDNFVAISESMQVPQDTPPTVISNESTENEEDWVNVNGEEEKEEEEEWHYLVPQDNSSIEHWPPFPQTLFRRLVVNPFISGATHFKDHPIADPLALLTAFPGAINAFCSTIDIDPKDLVAGISKMSPGELAFALFNAFCSFAPNSAMNASFYTGVKEDLKDSIKVFKQGLVGKLIIVLALFTGASAAAAAGAMGYSAFLWMPYGEVLAFLPAFLAAAQTFISRFNGLIRIIKRIREALSYYFNEDKQFTKKVREKLDLILDDFEAVINDFLQGKPLNEKTLEELCNELEKIEQALILKCEIDKHTLITPSVNDIKKIAEDNKINLEELFLKDEPLSQNNLDDLRSEINRLTTPSEKFNAQSVFKTTSCADSVKSAAWYGLKLSLASVVGYYTFQTFDQKGFDGIKILIEEIAKLANTIANAYPTVNDFAKNTNDIAKKLAELSNSIKILIGTFPGAATALFYFIHLFDLPDVVVNNLFAHLKENPADIPHAFAISVACVFSGSSMLNIVSNIIENPNNIFGDSANTLSGEAKKYIMATAAALVNAKVIFSKYPIPPLPEESPTLKDVQAFAHKNTFSPELLEGLRQNSLFRPQETNQPKQRAEPSRPKQEQSNSASSIINAFRYARLVS